MKNTYLLQKLREDGTSELVEATAAEWKKAITMNRHLPSEMRKHFIVDCIEDGNDIDRMVIEVSYEKFKEWNSKHTISERNRKLEKEFSFISLSKEIYSEDGCSLLDYLASEDNPEKKVIDALMKNELCSQLSAWRPWAMDVLNLYLNDDKSKCTSFLAEKYKVSEQTARKYKRQFEEFIKKFTEGVSF